MELLKQLLQELKNVAEYGEELYHNIPEIKQVHLIIQIHYIKSSYI